MTFTVALVGGDGAGKTSIARRLEASSSRYKYLYMGQSVLSSNAALPTSRLVRALKRRGQAGPTSESGAVGAMPPSPDLHDVPKKRRGVVRRTAGLLNRLVEAWWRQVLSVIFLRRGLVVVYDRHFLFESAVAVETAGTKRPKRIERLEYWLLDHFYPKPDLVILLDAQPAVLFQRKAEMSLERLERQRQAMLRHGATLPAFVAIDASRPLEDVLSDVAREIDEFRWSRERSNPEGAATSARRIEREPGRVSLGSSRRPADQPPAIVVGLDHLNGIQTARILARHHVPVIAFAKDPRHPGCRTRVCRQIRFVDTGSDELVAALEDLGPSLSHKAVLFPCTDMQVLMLSRNRQRLDRWYHLVLPAPETVEMLMDKVAFYRYAQAEGFPIPSTRFLHSRADAVRVSEELAFPCVLKPPMSADPRWEMNSTLKAYVLPTPDRLLAAYDRLSPLADMLIAQEWIEGPISDLYSCNCYFDRDGQPVASFVSRKIRQWPPDTGESSSGEECRNEAVLEETLRLFRRVGLRGLGYMEMKRDARSGNHFIVEPNVGRPTGRSPIAEAGGVELIYAMYCDALGRPLPARLTQTYGHAKWIDLRRDLQSALYQWRSGDLTVGEWWRSVRGPKTHALFSWTDPGPFIGDLLRAARLFVSPRERRKRDYRDPLSHSEGTQGAG